MNKKIPNIYKKEITKDHINNKTVSSVRKEIDNKKTDNTSVSEKLNKLFKSNRYVFNIGVIIKTKKKDYDTKIIGKIKNSIITMEDDVIPIIEIEDIIIKDR